MGEVNVPNGEITVRDAMLAVMRAGRLVVGLWKNPRLALDIIRPYSDCREYASDRPDAARIVRAFVCGVTGDCYRLLGEFRKAAEWYRESGESGEMCGFAQAYADIVLQNELADHYSAALRYLGINQAQNLAMPFYRRVYLNLVSCWWLDPSLWRLKWLERSFIRRLEALVGERPEGV